MDDEVAHNEEDRLGLSLVVESLVERAEKDLRNYREIPKKWIWNLLRFSITDVF